MPKIKTNRAAAKPEVIQTIQTVLNLLFGKLQLRDIAGQLLAQGQRCRIHQMGAVNLDHIGKRRSFGCQGRTQAQERG